MLPKGWSQVPLHTVAEVRTGLSKNASREGAVLKRPYIRVANVLNGTLDLADVKEIDVPENQVSRYTLRVGDLLLIEGNGNPENLGRSCLWGGQVPDAVHQNHVFVVRTFSNDELLPEFLAQQTQSKYGRNYFLSCAKGSTGLSSLNSSQLKSFPLLVPPPAEQRRIVQILSTRDRAIATSENLLANAQRHMEGLLQHLLIAPAARGDWDTRPIGELSERIQRRANEGEELPVLMISSGSGFVRQNEKYSRFMAGKSVENYIALDRGEFAYNKGNSKSYEFGCVFSLNTYERGLVPNVYVCFKLSSNLNAIFYEHLFRADFLHDQLGALVNTGVRNNGLLNIKPVDFLACQVPVPPLDVQHGVAEVLTTAAKWVALQERDLELLKQEKAALMSQLLTGKRRVKLPEAETEVQA